MRSLLLLRNAIGAAQTIEKLLNKPDTRSAAVTMLGKTVELCSDKVCRGGKVGGQGSAGQEKRGGAGRGGVGRVEPPLALTPPPLPAAAAEQVQPPIHEQPVAGSGARD